MPQTLGKMPEGPRYLRPSFLSGGFVISDDCWSAIIVFSKKVPSRLWGILTPEKGPGVFTPMRFGKTPRICYNKKNAVPRWESGETPKMENLSALWEARALLEDLTPLKSDCGRRCGQACCRSQTGEPQGMLLFPGEEDFYRDRPGYRMLPCAQGTLLVCDGHCRREERPLSCRLFPLLPLVRGNAVAPAMDRRGRGICPLVRQGLEALDPAFVAAVTQVGERLLTEPVQASFLRALTAEQDEWARLSQALGAKR